MTMGSQQLFGEGNCYCRQVIVAVNKMFGVGDK